MGRPRKRARVQKWRGHWTLFYFDHLTGRQVRKSCESLEAFTKEERDALVEDYRSREVNERAEVQRRGGLLAYDTPLADALDKYEAEVDERLQEREECPDGRAGLAPATGLALKDTLRRFKEWLAKKHPRMRTADLDAQTLKAFLRSLRAKAQTRNKHARHLRAAIYWLGELRPALFPDLDALRSAFKPVRTDPPKPVCYKPKDLRKLLEKALTRERDGYSVRVEREKGGRVEQYDQPIPMRPALPLSRVLLLLALTGARRGEVLNLRWDDVDLERGRLTLRASKTGRTRVLPLTGAPEAEVAPRLLSLLRRWKLEAAGREWVLPHGGDDAPAWPETAWVGLCKAAKVKIRPQGCRQTFCAIASSLGVPATVSALWQGHGTAVAERWYRSSSPDRVRGAQDFEEALGLAKVLDQLVAAPGASGAATA